MRKLIVVCVVLMAFQWRMARMLQGEVLAIFLRSYQ